MFLLENGIVHWETQIIIGKSSAIREPKNFRPQFAIDHKPKDILWLLMDSNHWVSFNVMSVQPPGHMTGGSCDEIQVYHPMAWDSVVKVGDPIFVYNWLNFKGPGAGWTKEIIGRIIGKQIIYVYDGMSRPSCHFDEYVPIRNESQSPPSSHPPFHSNKFDFWGDTIWP
jgi:hypothetical protein